MQISHFFIFSHHPQKKMLSPTPFSFQPSAPLPLTRPIDRGKKDGTSSSDSNNINNSTNNSTSNSNNITNKKASPIVNGRKKAAKPPNPVSPEKEVSVSKLVSIQIPLFQQ